MQRRQFLSGIVGSAAAWPLAVHALESKLAMVGLLGDRAANDSVVLMEAPRKLDYYLCTLGSQFRLETFGVADALREMELQEEPDLQKKRMLETMLEIARETPRRQASFVERIGDLYQCPCCWLRYERHTDLISLGGETEDFGQAGLKQFQRLRCEPCNFEYRILDGAQDNVYQCLRDVGLAPIATNQRAPQSI